MSEQNNQLKVQKREYMLMDMYKIHAYIPNDAEGNPLTPFGNFCAGYEAATVEANKRIESLEALVRQQDIDDANWRKQVSELKANNHDLRVALKFTMYSLEGSGIPSNVDPANLTVQFYKCKNIIREVLSATPAESMRAHDDEVISGIAILVNNETGNADLVARIEALKGKI